MAITNAQQYQQLVNKPANGKRPGYRGSSYGSPSRSSSQGPAGGASSGGNYGGNRNNSSSGNGGGSGRQDRDSQYTGGGYDSSKNVSGRTTTTSGKDGGSNYTTTTTPIKKPEKTKDNFKKPNIIQNYFENSLFTKGLRALKNSRLAQLNSQKQRENYLNNLQITNPELYQETIDDLEKLGYYNPDPVEYYGPESKGAARDIEQFPDLYEDQAGSILNTVRDNFDDEGTATVGTLYDDYLDSLNTPTGGGGGDNQVMDPCKGPNPPAYCFVGDDTEEDTTPKRNLGGLAPRFMGSIFDFTGLAEGGRVAAQQGGIMSQQGGIMPRLNDLGTDVSSAEQMLQEINQRLQSAESTLGEGGGDPSSGLIAIQPNNFNNFQPRQMPIGQPQPGSANQLPGFAPSIGNYTPFSGETFNQVPEQFRAGFDEYRKENPIGIGGQAMSYSMLPDGNRVMFGNTASASGFSDYLKSIGQGVSPIGTAIDSGIRQGAMDGGRMRQMEMMEDEDDPTGGIMDLESGRQMYFLGKLVKKAGRAIKKVVKSPIGKAALLYGLGSLGAGFVGKAQAGTGTGFFSNLFKSGKGKNLLSGIFDYAKDNPYKSIFGLSTLAGLSGESKDEDKPIDIGEGINIDRFRYAPYRTLAPSIVGSNYQTGTEGRKDGGRMGYQEGGDAEPVAKKTMPLLDMDGMEKDYREDGGFVPIGRMERADDVPARLSKNEFVFTADAVRNAGDGDIDKGAEVMYNMMKNLESGGEVSEESQGLDGAREMFQTSKRLEEVL
jgi:hypothetical protein